MQSSPAIERHGGQAFRRLGMEAGRQRLEELTNGWVAHLTSFLALCEKTFVADTSPCPKCGKPTVPVTREGTITAICTICDTPDRVCTWCKVPMTKKLVGNGQFLHYICPKCVFQHTSKFAAP